ncbi:hypothetical protein D9758_012999 [Tetrapyrgos nigripes]|uniref:Phospholipase C/P1 nuclease n=1 Tax=Tetrapyrgos nigripes TaxID=182062 RepID=A0A8H5C9L8_9AGAR|nr:hypothetical protein D9758_012999 [Tetrapyrgos nigripes]
MKLSAVSALLVGCLSAPGVFAWGAAGHEIVATIAQIHLHPTVLPKLCTILNYTSTNPNEPQCHLAPISTWADRFKYRMRWSAALHYVGARDDYPSKTCAFPGEHGWAGSTDKNVLGGIHNTTYLLDEWTQGTSSVHVADEALRFLVHFIGDLHMPLHLTGRDRGGNSVKVLFDGRQTNLHSLWDGLLIAKTLRTVPRKYDHPLPLPQVEYNLRGAIYDSWIRRIMWEGILGEWKDEVSSWLTCPVPETQVTAESQPMVPASTSTFGYTWNSIISLWNYLSTSVSASFSPTITEVSDTESLCPQHWAQPIHKLNCDLVWPAALDEPPYIQAQGHGYGHDDDHAWLSPEDELAMFDNSGRFVGTGDNDQVDTTSGREYTGVIADQRILEKLMAQGGIRLAGVLNSLFADDDGLQEGGDRKVLSVFMD